MAEVDTEVRPEGHKIPHRAEISRRRDRQGVMRAEGVSPDRPARGTRAAGPTHDTGRAGAVGTDDRERVDGDTYVRDNLGIRRILRDGARVPVGWEVLDDEAPEPVEQPEDPNAPAQYADRDVDDLEAEVEQRRAAGRDIDVEGTGSRGNVVKADLVAALEADDAAQAEQGQGEGNEDE